MPYYPQVPRKRTDFQVLYVFSPSDMIPNSWIIGQGVAVRKPLNPVVIQPYLVRP
jgi:hypothetical protein